MTRRRRQCPAAFSYGHRYLSVAYTCSGIEKTCLVSPSYAAFERIVDFLAAQGAGPVVLDARVVHDPELRYLLDRYALTVCCAPAGLPEAIVDATRRLGPAKYHVVRLLRRMTLHPPLGQLLRRTTGGGHIDPHQLQLSLMTAPHARTAPESNPARPAEGGHEGQ